MKHKEIVFKNRKYILVEGAITTKRNYERGIIGYAHLFDDGVIRRFGKKIGTKEDIKFTGKEIIAKGTFTGFMRLLYNSTYFPL